MATQPITVEKGAIQINNKDAIWRKLVPTDDNYVIISDSSLDKGAYWGPIPTPIVNQADIMCTELTCPLLVADENDYSPLGYDSTQTVLIMDSTGAPGVDITGLIHYGQCFVVLFNHGTNSWKLKSEDGASAAANRFALGSDLTVQPSEAVQLFYINTISRWAFVGGKH